MIITPTQENHDKKFSQTERLSFIQTGKSEAYKTALDIRKFEIQMFWTRANYFFLFVSAAFAAYGIVLGWKTADIGISDQTRRLVLLLISGVGFIVSLAWYLANKGGKFWQENWEYHVDLLERDEVGCLYRTVLSKSPNGLGVLNENRKSIDSISDSNGIKKNVVRIAGAIRLLALPLASVFRPSQSYPYSPTKVNLILSAFTTALFFLVFMASFIKFQGLYWPSLRQISSAVVLEYSGLLVLALVGFFGVWMIFSCRSSTEDTKLSVFASYRSTEVKEDITPN